MALARGKQTTELRSERPQALKFCAKANDNESVSPASNELLAAYRDQYSYGVLGLIWFALLTWMYLLWRKPNP